MTDMRSHAILGVIPPSVAEAMIAWRVPSLAARRGVAQLVDRIQGLARSLFMSTIRLPLLLSILIIIPVTLICLGIAMAAWLLAAPFYFLRVLPFMGKRYLLTNQRLVIQKYPAKGIQPIQEIKLTDIRSVKTVAGSEMPFYLSADLEILGEGDKKLMVLEGVPEFENFKCNIEDAYKAWAREMPKEQLFPASALK